MYILEEEKNCLKFTSLFKKKKEKNQNLREINICDYFTVNIVLITNKFKNSVEAEINV